MTALFLILGYALFVVVLAGAVMLALDVDEPPSWLVNPPDRTPVPPYQPREEVLPPWDGVERRAKVIN